MNPFSKIAWGLFCLMALLAPWLLGGRAPYAHHILGSVALLSAVAALAYLVLDYREWRHFKEFERRRGTGRANPLHIFFKGSLWTVPLWIFILLLFLSYWNPAYQAVSSPQGTRLLYQDFIQWLPTVVNPVRSRPGIYFLIALLAAIGLLSNPHLRPQGRWVRRMLLVLLINAVVLTLAGYIFHLLGNGRILGFFEPRADYFFSTFYYKNHWAAYAILYCGVAACFFSMELPHWLEGSRHTGGGGLALVAILFMGLSFPAIDSRSGIILCVMFGCVFLVFLLHAFRSIFARLAIALGAVACFAGIILLSIEDLRENWDRTEYQIDKAESVFLIDNIRAVHSPEVCAQLIQIRPLLGWGYLSYSPLFDAFATDFFRDENGGIELDMEFAHNDWFQSTVEFGILGMGLLCWFVMVNPRSRNRLQTAKSRQSGLPFQIGYGLKVNSRMRTGWILLPLYLLSILACWDFPFSNPAVLANAGFLLTIVKTSVLD